MQVTSDSLFHFTTSLKNLNGILRHKFQVYYCRETYDLDGHTYVYYYPMVSFCDIPLSLAKDQITRYGHFAIGLTKEWGIRNGLNPVVYVESKSLLAKDIAATVEHIRKFNESMEKERIKVTEANDSIGEFLKKLEGKSVPLDQRAQFHQAKLKVSEAKGFIGLFVLVKQKLQDTSNTTFSIFRYIKNYHGTLTRKGKVIKNYRFYDEREWRFVPSQGEIKTMLKPKEYEELKGSASDKPCIKSISLPFVSEDIKYLIVNSNSDIPKLIKIIQSTDHLVANRHQADILTTKIMTVEQLRNDF